MCAVVQSSGMGKSRTIYELGKTHFLIPMILRKGTSGYPPPDDEVRDFLVMSDSGATDSPDRARRRCIRFFCSLFRNTLLALRRAQNDDASVLTKADMIRWFYSRMAPPENNTFRKEFFRTVVQDAQKDGSQSTESSGTSSNPGRRAVLDMINVYVIFLSTTGQISQSNPHRGVDPSMRVKNEEYKPVPPFTTLRYDLYGPQLIRAKDGSFMLSEDQIPTRNDGVTDLQAAEDQTLTLPLITNTAFIVRFGRPLFALVYGNGVKNGILRLAMDKLICDDISKFNDKWKEETPAHVELACLSQRLCLEFNSTACNDDEQIQIAAHMRLCLKIGPDGQYIISSSGSEPLLAEAAATLMMRDAFNPAESLHRVLTGFSIHKGDQGELISMLAVIVARDVVVRRKMQETPELNSALLGILPPDKETQQPAFRAVQIIDLLDELFELPKKAKEALEADFGDTYTYFNHFIKPFTQAVHCANCMPGVDFVLPTLKGLELHTGKISVVAAQAKLDDTITRERDGESIFENITHGLEQEIFRDAPIVRMVFSLRSKAKLWYEARTIRINGKKVRTHDFWCGGFGPHFLPKKKEDDDTWLALVLASEKMRNVFLVDLNRRIIGHGFGPGGDGESMDFDEDT
ncbi:hypothetical protein ACEPAI_2741 [Sanghuangporus weigelae]